MVPHYREWVEEARHGHRKVYPHVKAGAAHDPEQLRKLAEGIRWGKLRYGIEDVEIRATVTVLSAARAEDPATYIYDEVASIRIGGTDYAHSNDLDELLSTFEDSGSVEGVEVDASNLAEALVPEKVAA